MDFIPVGSTQTNKSKNKKRFSDEQIKLLESMFNSETRPESQSKQQIANQLGLKPRQVAIWFQNRRARSKLKQIEHDYRVLKDSYDCLATRLKGTEDRFHEDTKFELTASSFLGEEINIRPHDAYVYANDVDEFQGNQQTALLGMVDALSGSPLSSGNGYSLESVFEPDYVVEDKCCSGWWEAID
ncbi:hypothetical protein V2J09_020123 [Rumex salicifolius]